LFELVELVRKVELGQIYRSNK